MKLRSMRHVLLAASLTSVLSSCAPEGVDDDELDAVEQELIRDQNNGGKAGFFFLPPVAAALPFSSGAFESRLEPVVRIDQVDGNGNTVKNVATYKGSAASLGERILRNLGQKFYVVRFKGSSVSLNPSLNYRIRVLPADGQPELGFADIDVVNSLFEFPFAYLRKSVPMLKGQTLAIRFRIDKNAVDRDGDGVFDWLDNCPGVKNPPQAVSADVPPVTSRPPASCNPEQTACDPQEQPLNPLPKPKQPDADNDGIGDACDCPVGYGGTPPSCTDIDECQATPSKCAPNQICHNDAGSYSCETCPPNTHPEDGQCVADGFGFTAYCECQDGPQVQVCATSCAGDQDALCPAGCNPSSVGCFAIECDATTCEDGYERVNGVCTDIDECATSPGICGENSLCQNFPPPAKYGCAECPSNTHPEGDRCVGNFTAACRCNDDTRFDVCDDQLDCEGDRDATIARFEQTCDPLCADHGGFSFETGGVCWFREQRACTYY